MYFSPAVKMGLAGLGMMGVGAGLGAVGYILLKRKLETEFEERLKFEIAETKAYYSRLNKTDAYEDPTVLAEAYERSPEDETILEMIEKKRASGKPYLITQDAFTEAYEDAQFTLVYYEGDDVLASDVTDVVIEDTEDLVGNDNLLHWGWGSGDKELIYVRNEKESQVFEIHSNKGSYAKDVLGFVEHSEPRGRPRKFRRDYE